MIRLALAGDAVALGNVLQDWIEATDFMPKLHSRLETQGFLAHLIATSEVYVAGDALGFIALGGGEVTCLYLAAQARGQGVGTALLDEAKARRDTLELWCFQANTQALGFYRTQGFVEVRRTDGADNDEKLPDVRLLWTR